MIAIRSAGVPVKKGDKLCGTRIIPLVIEKEAMEKAKDRRAIRRFFGLNRSVPASMA